MKGMTRLLIGGVVLVAVVLAGVLWIGRNPPQVASAPASATAPAVPPPAPAGHPQHPSAAPAKEVPVTAVPRDGMVADMVLGDPNAPVTMIEYSSLTCPHCAAFHRDTLPRIKQEFIDTGKVKLIYRDFPFDGVALGGAMLARCVPTERYFGFMETLFATQSNWAYSKNPLQALMNLAQLAGIPQDKFQACLSDQQVMEGIKAKQQEGQEKFGIESTPSFVIGDKVISGNQPFDNFAQALRAAK